MIEREGWKESKGKGEREKDGRRVRKRGERGMEGE